MSRGYRDVRGFTGEKFLVRIFEIDDGIVGDHVLHGVGIQVDVVHPAMKNFVGERVHLKGDIGTAANRAGV